MRVALTPDEILHPELSLPWERRLSWVGRAALVIADLAQVASDFCRWLAGVPPVRRAV